MQVIGLCTVLNSILCTQTHLPQVYEAVDDTYPSEITRKARQSDTNNSENLYQMPVFDYRKAFQQDPQKQRYSQQQQIDTGNQARVRQLYQNQHFLKHQPESQESFIEKEHGSFPHLGYNWKIVHPKFVKENRNALIVFDVKKSKSKKRNVNLEDIREEIEKRKTEEESKISKRKIIDDKGEEMNIDRQDHINLQNPYLSNPHTIFIKPENIEERQKILQQNLGGFSIIGAQNEIDALNSLLGKHPNAQLQGLRQLLSLEAHPQPFQLIKDHTPITEQQVDFKNPQIRPNIKIESHPEKLHAQSIMSVPVEQSLSQLQSQLDVATHAHIQEVLQQAQQKAAASVEAQHQIINQARVQAEKTALDQILRAQAEAETLALLQVQKENNHNQQIHTLDVSAKQFNQNAEEAAHVLDISPISHNSVPVHTQADQAVLIPIQEETHIVSKDEAYAQKHPLESSYVQTKIPSIKYVNQDNLHNHNDVSNFQKFKNLFSKIHLCINISDRYKRDIKEHDLNYDEIIINSTDPFDYYVEYVDDEDDNVNGTSDQPIVAQLVTNSSNGKEVNIPENNETLETMKLVRQIQDRKFRLRKRRKTHHNYHNHKYYNHKYNDHHNYHGYHNYKPVHENSHHKFPQNHENSKYLSTSDHKDSPVIVINNSNDNHNYGGNVYGHGHDGHKFHRHKTTHHKKRYHTRFSRPTRKKIRRINFINKKLWSMLSKIAKHH